VIEARTDVVGSLLRPPELVAAQDQLARGELAPTESRKRFLSAEEFTYLRGRTDRVIKVTLPSPSLRSGFARRLRSCRSSDSRSRRSVASPPRSLVIP